MFILKREGSEASEEGIGSVWVSLSANKKERESTHMCQGAIFR